VQPRLHGWFHGRHFAGTRGNRGGVALQFHEVFERFVKNPIALIDLG